jgi:pimeloyl-ACP methyl ester carboxylesterase
MEPVFAKKKGYKRIYFDLPGMGKTKGSDKINNSDDILILLEKFVEIVIPNENYLVVGESYGGYLTRGLVYKDSDNVDGVLLICPLIIADDSKRNVAKGRTFYSNKDLYKTLNQREKQLIRLLVVQSEKNWKRLKKEFVSDKGNWEFRKKIRTVENYQYSFDVDKLSAKFDKPSLIIAGRQDFLVGYKDIYDFLDYYPRATFAILDRAGHFAQIEQEELFNALAIEWLERLEK